MIVTGTWFIFALIGFVLFAVGDVGMDYLWNLFFRRSVLTSYTIEELRKKTKVMFMDSKRVSFFAACHMAGKFISKVAVLWFGASLSLAIGFGQEFNFLLSILHIWM
jgi:hypothetical protein